MRPLIQRLLRVSSVVVFCLNSSVAMGGQTSFGADVYVLPNSPFYDSFFANGSISSARFSADSLQNIGCEVVSYRNIQNYGTFTVTSNPSFAWCFARDSKSNLAVCFTTLAGMIATAGRINDTSWIYFAYDRSGNCTYLEVYNSSEFVH